MQFNCASFLPMRWKRISRTVIGFLLPYCCIFPCICVAIPKTGDDFVSELPVVVLGVVRPVSLSLSNLHLSVYIGFVRILRSVIYFLWWALALRSNFSPVIQSSQVCQNRSTIPSLWSQFARLNWNNSHQNPLAVVSHKHARTKLSNIVCLYMENIGILDHLLRPKTFRTIPIVSKHCPIQFATIPISLFSALLLYNEHQLSSCQCLSEFQSSFTTRHEQFTWLQCRMC